MTGWVIYRNGVQVAQFRRLPRVRRYLLRAGLGSAQVEEVLAGATVLGFTLGPDC